MHVPIGKIHEGHPVDPVPPTNVRKTKQSLELLHQILPHSPHTRPLPIDIHRHRSQQTSDLNASNSHKDILGAIGFEPAVEEEGEDQTVEDICR